MSIQYELVLGRLLSNNSIIMLLIKNLFSGMIGEEVNSCIQPHAENIWKTPNEVAEHNAKATNPTIPNSARILMPKGMLQRQMLQNTSQGHKAQANPTCDPGTKCNSPNYKSTTSYDRHTKFGLQPPPTLVNTPHPAYHRHSPCPLTNSLPHPTHYAISHHSSDYIYRSTLP